MSTGCQGLWKPTRACEAITKGGTKKIIDGMIIDYLREAQMDFAFRDWWYDNMRLIIEYLREAQMNFALQGDYINIKEHLITTS